MQLFGQKIHWCLSAHLLLSIFTRNHQRHVVLLSRLSILPTLAVLYQPMAYNHLSSQHWSINHIVKIIPMAPSYISPCITSNILSTFKVYCYNLNMTFASMATNQLLTVVLVLSSHRSHCWTDQFDIVKLNCNEMAATTIQIPASFCSEETTILLTCVVKLNQNDSVSIKNV